MVNKKTKAWVVTWEGTKEHSFPGNKHVTFFNKRVTETKIQKYLELIYSLAFYSLEERLRFALDPKSNPYPAMASVNTKKRQTVITCGHNPFLQACIVDDPKIVTDENGQDPIHWNRNV